MLTEVSVDLVNPNLVPRPRRTTSDKKLGGAWERGYTKVLWNMKRYVGIE